MDKKENLRKLKSALEKRLKKKLEKRFYSEKEIAENLKEKEKILEKIMRAKTFGGVAYTVVQNNVFGDIEFFIEFLCKNKITLDGNGSWFYASKKK